MQRLILLRHAKAESTFEADGDFGRALTERGLRDAALMGRALAKAGLTPDKVLVSTARRARQTWDEMAHAFPAARVENDAALYLASREHIGQAVDRIAADAAVGLAMVVGHNPGLHEFAMSLLRPAAGMDEAHRLLSSFPTGCAAVFAFEPGGQARLERRLTPRDVGGGVL